IALESVLARAERSPAPPAPPPAPSLQPDLWSVMAPPETPPEALAEALAEPVAEAPEAPMALDVAEGSDPAPVEGVLPFAPAPAPAGTEVADPSDAPPAAEADGIETAPTLAARLRAVPAGTSGADPQALLALRERLRGLRDRLAEAARRRAR
ncbi:MAG: hypothetical protein RIR62_545, partial [Pseudomonadota bacterium]